MGMKELNDAWKIVEQEFDGLPDNYKKLNKAEKIKEFGIDGYRKTLKKIKNTKPKNISELSGYTIIDAVGRKYKVDEDGNLTEKV